MLDKTIEHTCSLDSDIKPDIEVVYDRIFGIPVMEVFAKFKCVFNFTVDGVLIKHSFTTRHKFTAEEVVQLVANDKDLKIGFFTKQDYKNIIGGQT